MDRINGAGHVDRLFVAEDIGTNRPPTEITAEWLNGVQEELATVIELAGLDLNVMDNTLLAQAIVSLIAASVVGAASEEAAGKVELATAEESLTGESTTRAVHPAGLHAALAFLNFARLGIPQTFSKAQRGAYVPLTDGATITPDFSLANKYRVQLGGNRTLANPTNLVAGQEFEIDVYQDSTGSRTLAYQWGYQFPGGAAPTLSTAARAKDKLVGNVDVYAQSAITISIATPGVVRWAGHGLLAGQPVQLTTTDALPTGLVANTTYYVIPVDDDSFQLSATQSGTAIATSGSQSGVHTMTACSITYALVKGVL